MAHKKMPKPKLIKTERWLKSHLVVFPVSYTYNGGTIMDGVWYEGFEVPAPDIPKGFKLTDIGIGLRFGVKPPQATFFLEPVV